MELLALALSGMLGTLCPHLQPHASPLPYLNSACNYYVSTNSKGYSGISGIVDELGPKLSGAANIYFPGSEGFDTATKRWSVRNAPNITVVVDVGTQGDVAETVKYANAHEVPFLAYGTGHGAISSLGNMREGILIWLRQLNSISVADDGQTATFGGGVRVKQVMEALWEKGKKTVTGSCECVGMMGPGLGGGHGVLQGRYGLIADQLVSLDMVLANGSSVTVNGHSDLWWAVKGAGHNFGIVTSFTSRIYDVHDDDQWAYQGFLFTHDKVEAVYTAINEYLLKDGIQPVDVISFSVFTNNPEADPDHSIVVFYILQEGVPAVEPRYVDPFMNINPFQTISGNGPYTDTSKWLGGDNNSTYCQKAGLVNILFPVDLQVYNVAAQRTAFDLFSHTTHANPALNNSVYFFEGYPVQGVRAVAAESTAFPHREANILTAPFISYEPAGAERDDMARAFGEQLRKIVFDGSGKIEMNAYVNYAFGEEGVESWYGFEPWRLERLRELKKKYDPEGRLGFYAPVREN
ncbi:hypothetical protein AJ79_09947 [Helicocarpus griseus UAMH5409]|uniref:FAD-binding PCMH-type domain-containing protein n=1 Tax=Helicocarpus griseus UAMH5409 TaxID=1447875 RepID=A0A2B7WG93_9EURO|nr:hypothetical protein AJ79_09947 [Helicocarpus griseus UAMH5409]